MNRFEIIKKSQKMNRNILHLSTNIIILEKCYRCDTYTYSKLYIDLFPHIEIDTRFKTTKIIFLYPK